MTRLSVLHVTNGDHAAARLRDAGLAGDILPWRDVLHEGPVPAGLGIAGLRARRAAYLASAGAGSIEAIERDLAARDRMLEEASRYEEVVLWFEHDLYDQLQLLQVLEALPGSTLPALSMPAVPTYIGHLATDRVPPLFAERRPVTSAQHAVARDAWAAFRSADPTGLIPLLDRVDALPHLGTAVLRLLQQFPSLEAGLSRSEAQVLALRRQGIDFAAELFRRSQALDEPAMFMGDLTFIEHIDRLTRGARPLLETADGGRLSLESRVRLTRDGERVARGEADRVEVSGIDRWIGGVHLLGHGPVWRWDQGRRRLVLR